jgi:hypothetical protein
VTTKISATVESFSLPVAATILGIRGASKSGVIRTALALFHGHDRADAIKYAYSNQGEADAATGRERIVADIPDELAVADNAALAVRIGIGLGMGLSRPQAEQWAKASVVMGRPRKALEQ